MKVRNWITRIERFNNTEGFCRNRKGELCIVYVMLAGNVPFRTVTYVIPKKLLHLVKNKTILEWPDIEKLIAQANA